MYNPEYGMQILKNTHTIHTHTHTHTHTHKHTHTQSTQSTHIHAHKQIDKGVFDIHLVNEYSGQKFLEPSHNPGSYASILII